MKPATRWFSESSSRRASSSWGPTRFWMSRAASDSVSVVAMGRLSPVWIRNVGSAAPDAQPEAGGKGDRQGDPRAAAHPGPGVVGVVELALQCLGGVHQLSPGPLDVLAELGL